TRLNRRSRKSPGSLNNKACVHCFTKVAGPKFHRPCSAVPVASYALTSPIHDRAGLFRLVKQPCVQGGSLKNGARYCLPKSKAHLLEVRRSPRGPEPLERRGHVARHRASAGRLKRQARASRPRV